MNGTTGTGDSVLVKVGRAAGVNKGRDRNGEMDVLSTGVCREGDGCRGGR